MWRNNMFFLTKVQEYILKFKDLILLLIKKIKNLKVPMKSKLNINPKILYDEKGNKKGVILKVKEFEKMIEELEDLHDLHSAYERLSKNYKPIPYEKIRKELLGDDSKK